MGNTLRIHPLPSFCFLSTLTSISTYAPFLPLAPSLHSHTRSISQHSRLDHRVRSPPIHILLILISRRASMTCPSNAYDTASRLQYCTLSYLATFNVERIWLRHIHIGQGRWAGIHTSQGHDSIDSQKSGFDSEKKRSRGFHLPHCTWFHSMYLDVCALGELGKATLKTELMLARDHLIPVEQYNRGKRGRSTVPCVM